MVTLSDIAKYLYNRHNTLSRARDINPKGFRSYGWQRHDAMGLEVEYMIAYLRRSDKRFEHLWRQIADDKQLVMGFEDGIDVG